MASQTRCGQGPKNILGPGGSTWEDSKVLALHLTPRETLNGSQRLKCENETTDVLGESTRISLTTLGPSSSFRESKSEAINKQMDIFNYESIKDISTDKVTIAQGKR